MTGDLRGIDHGINVCGAATNDPAIGKKVDVTFKHSGGNISLLFGSTLKGNSCFASYGISDLEVYVL